MKKFALATLVLACFSASAQVSTGAAGGIGGSSLTSTSAASASAVGRGSASVSAFNQGYSSTGVSSTVGVSRSNDVGAEVLGAPRTNAVTSGSGLARTTITTTTTPITQTTTDTKAGNVGVEGYSITANMSGITTRQSGTGLALGAASGSAVSGTAGAGTFNLGSSTSPSGNVQGLSGATTLSGVVSLGNGSNFQNGGMSTSFRGTASADLTTTVVTSSNQLSIDTRTILGNLPTVSLTVPTGVTSNSAVQNVGTTAVADAAGNSGFSGAPVIANTGLANGVLVNAGTANSVSNATVSNVVISGTAAGSL